MLDIALNGTDARFQAGDIHRRQGIDEHFISQILLMLRRAGLIESLRGRQGGHRLAPASVVDHATRNHRSARRER
jgi:DNA-binding IscR family transcriptional regulator